MIASLLKVDPKRRPTSDQILQMPVFKAKWSENADEFQSTNLLGTIRIPNNLSLLTDRLPKAQYEEIVKEQQQDRHLKTVENSENKKRVMPQSHRKPPKYSNRIETAERLVRY